MLHILHLHHTEPQNPTHHILLNPAPPPRERAYSTLKQCLVPHLSPPIPPPPPPCQNPAVLSSCGSSLTPSTLRWPLSAAWETWHEESTSF